MTGKELSERLAKQDVENICRQLLPGGKTHGKEYTCGSISGGEGQSMKVCIDGAKAGVWCDFATGDKGDLLGLYMKTKSVKFKDAIAWAKEYLGLRDNKEFQALPKMQKPRPIKPPAVNNNNPAMIEWFRNRGFTSANLKRYKVSTNGSVINLPYYQGPDVYHIKYKDIAKERKESWHCSPGSTPILFGWQAIPDDCREIVITEGEWDAMSYAEQGIPALSIPMGAGSGDKQKWIELEWDNLEIYDTIFLSFDMDDAGKAMLPSVVERLGHHRCRVIELPKKDANECHVAGVKLAEYKDCARYCDPKELRSMESFAEDVRKLFDGNENDVGDTLPWEKTEAQYRMRPGELTLWHGHSGHGKTMILSMIAAQLMNQGKRVCIASMEMPAAKLLKRMYQQIGSVEWPNDEYLNRITYHVTGKGWLVNIKGTAKADVVLRLLDYACRRYSVSHFIIDSLCKCGFGEDDYNGQKQFVDMLTDFTTERSVHIHLVAHDRKRETGQQKKNNDGGDDEPMPSRMDVKGSGGITDMADNVIAVWRNRRKESEQEQRRDDPDCFLFVQKQRHYDWEGKVALWYDRPTHQYLATSNDKPKPIMF